MPQKAATGWSGQLVERTRRHPRRRSVPAGHAGPRPMFSGPARRSASDRMAARSARARPGRRATGPRRPARRNDATGSRSRPRGSSRPSPNGSSASSRTKSRSRASRRCWNPSSSTRSSDSSSSTAIRARPDPIPILEVGDVRQVLLQHAALVVEPLRLPVAATQDHHPPAAPAEPAGHPLDHRGLAGAAHGQVADRDHRHAGSDATFEPAAVEARFRIATAAR